MTDEKTREGLWDERSDTSDRGLVAMYNSKSVTDEDREHGGQFLREGGIVLNLPNVKTRVFLQKSNKR